MQTTIDAAGRIVIPRSLRHQVGFSAGTVLDIRVEDGGLRIEPRAAAMRLEERQGFVVLCTDAATPPLTTSTVASSTDHVRERRDG